jgi:hypothetical protein
MVLTRAVQSTTLTPMCSGTDDLRHVERRQADSVSIERQVCVERNVFVIKAMSSGIGPLPNAFVYAIEREPLTRVVILCPQTDHTLRVDMLCWEFGNQDVWMPKGPTVADSDPH